MPGCMLMLISARDDIRCALFYFGCTMMLLRKNEKWLHQIVIVNEINDLRDTYLLLCACYR